MFDPSKTYTFVSYEVLVMDKDDNIMIDWVRVSENGLRLLLSTLCGASEDQIDNALKKHTPGYFIDMKGKGHHALITGKWGR